MSHTVTVTRTTTTTTTSAIIINTGFLKTWPGILKFFELILGIVVVGLTAHYRAYSNYFSVEWQFFLLIAVSFLIGTFLILLSCLLSISTASILPKTIYIFLYHLFAFLLYLIASIVFLVEVNRMQQYYSYEPLFAAGIIGLVISALYLGSTIFGYRSYKGL